MSQTIFKVKKAITPFLVILLLLFGKISEAQNFDEAKMDSLFMLIESNQKGMGTISLFKDGKEVYQNSIGFTSIKDEIKSTDKTKYRIGSISKTFTATIIMQLISEGKLDLSTKLSEYYPEIENAKKITIEYLLRHRSGIYNFTNAEDYTSWMESPISQEELVAIINDYESVFEPNEKAEYSNSNYVLLSFIAEILEGKDFGQIVENRICKPCELENTYYGSTISVSNNEALSYTRESNWEIATETDMSVPAGAGAIVSNPTDLNLFLNCLFSNNITEPATLKKMMELQDGYGIGMFRVPFYDKFAFGHTGGIDGFQSNAFYFPKENVSISYNSNGVVMALNDILIGALSIYFGKPYNLPEFTETLQLSTEDLDKYLGVYSSPTFPLKITITKNGNTLIAQATGQPSFPLESYETDKFRYDQAKLKIEFITAENQLLLLQGGGKFLLNKEE